MLIAFHEAFEYRGIYDNHNEGDYINLDGSPCVMDKVDGKQTTYNQKDTEADRYGGQYPPV